MAAEFWRMRHTPGESPEEPVQKKCFSKDLQWMTRAGKTNQPAGKQTILRGWKFFYMKWNKKMLPSFWRKGKNWLKYTAHSPLNILQSIFNCPYLHLFIRGFLWSFGRMNCSHASRQMYWKSWGSPQAMTAVYKYHSSLTLLVGWLWGAIIQSFFGH